MNEEILNYPLDKSYENIENHTTGFIMDLSKEKLTMTITATEFKTNLGKYLDLVHKEDILITKNGKVIAQLTQPQVDKMRILNGLVGIASGDDSSLNEIRDERLSKQ